jgi:hypothetical protein
MGDKIKKGEMGRICSMHGEIRNEHKMSENPKGRDHLENLGID